MLIDRDSVEAHKQCKNGLHDRTSLFNKGIIIWHKRTPYIDIVFYSPPGSREVISAMAPYLFSTVTEEEILAVYETVA